MKARRRAKLRVRRSAVQLRAPMWVDAKLILPLDLLRISVVTL
jgi:hypothetical protein